MRSRAAIVPRATTGSLPVVPAQTKKDPGPTRPPPAVAVGAPLAAPVAGRKVAAGRAEHNGGWPPNECAGGTTRERRAPLPSPPPASPASIPRPPPPPPPLPCPSPPPPPRPRLFSFLPVPPPP